MPKRELEAVIAHEISHIRNRDTYLMTMATVFAGVIALDRRHRLPLDRVRRSGRARAAGSSLVLAIVGFLLAPYAALLLRMSLSRRREFLADAGAAEILSDPEAMALALRRLELDPTTIRYADASTAHLWVESPTDRVDSERRGVLALSGLFNTHPPIGDAHRGARGGGRISAARAEFRQTGRSRPSSASCSQHGHTGLNRDIRV